MRQAGYPDVLLALRPEMDGGTWHSHLGDAEVGSVARDVRDALDADLVEYALGAESIWLKVVDPAEEFDEGLRVAVEEMIGRWVSQHTGAVVGYHDSLTVHPLDSAPTDPPSGWTATERVSVADR